MKENYIIWLKSKYNGKNGTISSYTKALENLSTSIKYNIFENTNLLVLDKLYKDLLQNQKDKNGIYFNKDSSSYGEKGF